MWKELKIDVPMILALMILVLFGFAAIFNMAKTGTLDADFKQTLFAITMVAVGFYLGSSSDSRKKTDLMSSPIAPLAAGTIVAAEPAAAQADVTKTAG